nr:MAG TPA: hypothetical protein [Caudoviricetes sp.]
MGLCGVWVLRPGGGWASGLRKREEKRERREKRERKKVT